MVTNHKKGAWIGFAIAPQGKTALRGNYGEGGPVGRGDRSSWLGSYSKVLRDPQLRSRLWSVTAQGPITFWSREQGGSRHHRLNTAASILPPRDKYWENLQSTGAITALRAVCASHMTNTIGRQSPTRTLTTLGGTAWGESASKLSMARRGPWHADRENYYSELRHGRQRTTQAQHQQTTGTTWVHKSIWMHLWECG